MNDQTAQTQSSLNNNVPATAPEAASAGAPQSAQGSAVGQSPEQHSEDLQDQNIFFLLGVTDGSNEQKETFLDELQQVIWEDFIEHDSKLLITAEEQQELQKILDNQESKELDQQEEVVVFLERIIPELEEIMLTKALELKADLLRERIAGMKEYFAGKDDAIQKLQRSEELVLQERWYSAADLLNTL